MILGILFACNLKMYSFAYGGPSGSTQISTGGPGSSDSGNGSGGGGSGSGGGGNSSSGGSNNGPVSGPISGPPASTPDTKSDNDSSSTKKEEVPAEKEITAEELFFSELETYVNRKEEIAAADSAIGDGGDGYQTYIDFLMALNSSLPSIENIENENSETVNKSKEELQEKKNSENSSELGDPVKITEGTYVQEETDFVFGKRNLLNMQRLYSSDNKIVSSLGYGWSTNLDQRIIFGIEPNLQQIIEAIKTYKSNVPNLVSTYEKEGAKALGVSDIYKASDEFNGRMSACDVNISSAYSILDSLNELGIKAQEAAERSALQKAREEVSALYNKIYYKKNRIYSNKTYIEWMINHFEALKWQAAEYDEKLKTYNSKLPEFQLRKSKNKYVMFSGMSSNYEETGFDTITVIDANGYPHLLYETLEGSRIWINEKDKSIIDCIYSNGEMQLKKSDGTINIFDGSGFLSKIVDLNGNYVKINRNSFTQISSVETSDGESFIFTYENGFIKSITNARDTTQNVIYYYSGNILSGVKDSEDDVVTMNYDSSHRLISLNKCDGSSIKFFYSVNGSDGKILTTATTNEENFTEYFEYDRENHKTTYINHDNNQTVYFYDDKHRTTKEIHSEGTVIEYEYGPDDEYLKITENGITTTTYYDLSGNKIRVEYDDLSYESFSYDKNNYLTVTVDRDGVKSEYIRDENSNLLEYRVSGRTVFTQKFDKKGNIIERKDYGSQITTSDYSYDSFGNLVLLRVNNIQHQYKYDSQNRIKKYSINGKEISRYSYAPKITVQTDYNGLETTAKINGRKDVVNIVKKDLQTGKTVETKIDYDKRHLPQNYYEGDGEKIKQRFRCLYSGAGNLTAYIIYSYGDENNYVWLYFYQNEKATEMHKFAVKGELRGDVTYQELLNLEQMVGDNIYVKKFDTAKETKEIVSQLIYTSAGRTTGFQTRNGGWYRMNYDSSGNLSYIGEENGNGISATYYTDGMLASKTDQYGKISFYKYNHNGDMTEVVTENKVTAYEYDIFGRVTEEKVVNSNQQELYHRKFVYSEDGRSFEIIEGDFYKTKCELDAFGNVVKETLGNENETQYVYDELGNVVHLIDSYGGITKYTWNALGKILSVIKPDNSAYYYEYDFLGNLVAIKDEEGIVYNAEYDDSGRLVKEWNRGDVEKSYRYDKRGNITMAESGGEPVEIYAYDNWMRNISVMDGNGNEYVYKYDELGRLIEEKNREGEVMEYSYDEAGEIKQRVYFDGTVERVQYSSDRMICTINYSDGSKNSYKYDALGNILCAENENSKITYEYDMAGLLIKQTDEITGEILEFFYNSAKKRIRMIGSSRDTVYRYGRKGELIEAFDNKQRFSLKINYDKNGREKQRIYNNGIEEEIFYDRAGRKILIVQKSAMKEVLWAEGYVYGKNGKRIATVNEKGAVELYEYNKRGFISKVYYPYSQSMVEKLKVDAEENGFPAVVDCGENKFLTAELKNAIDILMNKIGYGWDSKVSNMQLFICESFKYDGNGNRVEKKNPFGIVHYTYDSENRLISSGGNGRTFVRYSYSKNGNLLTKESDLCYERFEYTADNRLSYSEVINKSKKEYTVTHYSYDAFGRRVTEQDFENPALGFMYDGFTLDVVKQGPVFKNGSYTDTYETGIKYLKSGRPTKDRYRYLEDDNSDNNRYFYLNEENYKTVNSRRVDPKNRLYAEGSIVAQTLEEEISYFTKDILGSVRTVSNENGQMVLFYDYDIYGSAIEGKFMGTNDFGYLSKPYDSITTLYNYGFRDFSPSLARFTTSDPIRDGTNWFTYANNDPVNFVDLWGLEQVSILGNNLMQDERWNEKTLAGTDVKFQKAGCAVMIIADMLNISPEAVNKRYVKDGALYWSKVAEDINMNVDRQRIPFTMENFLSQVDDSNNIYQTIIEVNWTTDKNKSKHFVGLRDMKVINGKEYAVITPTSYYDTLTSSGKFKYSEERIAQGWMVYEGQVLVPVSQIVGYVNFKKGK